MYLNKCDAPLFMDCVEKRTYILDDNVHTSELYAMPQDIKKHNDLRHNKND